MKAQRVAPSQETLETSKVYEEHSLRLKCVYIETIEDLAKMNLKDVESKTGIGLEELYKIKIMAMKQLQFGMTSQPSN